MAAQDWQLSSRGGQCAGTEKAFDDGETVYSRLVRTEEGYLREDYCKAGWEALGEEVGLSHWQSVYRKPPPPKAEPLKKENAEDLLRRLMETEEEQYLNTIYILAAMLERKRILAEQDVQMQEDGVKLRVYEHRQTGESFVIRDPQLKLAELDAVQQEVVLMLGGKPPGHQEEAAGEAENAEEGGEGAEEGQEAGEVSGEPAASKLSDQPAE